MKKRYYHALKPLKIGNVVLKNRYLSSTSMPHFLQGPEQYPSAEVINYTVNTAKNGAAVVSFSDWSNTMQRSMPGGDICRFPLYDFNDPSLDNYMCKLAEGVHCYDSKLILAFLPQMPQGYGVVEVKGAAMPGMPAGFGGPGGPGGPGGMPDMPGGPGGPGGMPGMPEGFGGPGGPGGMPGGPDAPGSGLNSMIMHSKRGEGDDPRWPTKSKKAANVMEMPEMPCKQLELPQMEQMIQDAIKKLRRYQSFGFDGASVHMAYGLPGCAQFLSPLTNKRTDEFGGSLENRTRFPMMLCRAIREEFGPDFLIEVILSGQEEGGWTIEDSVGFAKIAEGVVDMFQIREATGDLAHPVGFNSSRVPTTLEVAAAIKASGSSMITVPIGGFQNPDIIEEAIATGKTDMVGAARAFIADYNYGKKLQEGRGEDVVPCIRCNRCHGLHMDGPWVVGCSVNPEVGLSDVFAALAEAPEKKKSVAVIGGGISGMYAAIQCAERGHDVSLYEKTDYLGGQFLHAEYATFKWPMQDYKNYLVRQLEKLQIKVYMNTEATPEMIEEAGYDTVIAALGAEPNVPAIAGVENPGLWIANDVFGKESELQENVVIVGGSEIGVETGLYLAENGHKVTLLSRQPLLAYGAYRVHYYDPLREAWEHEPNFSYILEATTTAVNTDAVTYVDKTGAEKTISGCSVVIAGGMNPLQEKALAFYDAAPEFYFVGDCTGIGNVQKCIRDAHTAAMRV